MATRNGPSLSKGHKGEGKKSEPPKEIVVVHVGEPLMYDPGMFSVVGDLGDVAVIKVSLSSLSADDELGLLIKSSDSFYQEHRRHLLDFQEVFAAPMYSVVEAVKTGVSPKMLSVLSSEMGIPMVGMAERLGLASSTVRSKSASSKLLSIDDSEKVIGMSRLIGQVQAMVNEAGNPEGFDAAAWLANWMEQGLPALGGRKPSEYMDTAVGQALVSQLLAQIRSGAYA
jgi:uncharacterized protein (DUF2384 family)